jgi:hypothetical protein
MLQWYHTTANILSVYQALNSQSRLALIFHQTYGRRLSWPEYSECIADNRLSKAPQLMSCGFSFVGKVFSRLQNKWMHESMNTTSISALKPSKNLARWHIKLSKKIIFECQFWLNNFLVCINFAKLLRCHANATVKLFMLWKLRLLIF